MINLQGQQKREDHRGETCGQQYQPEAQEDFYRESIGYCVMAWDMEKHPCDDKWDDNQEELDQQGDDYALLINGDCP